MQLYQSELYLRSIGPLNLQQPINEPQTAGTCFWMVTKFTCHFPPSLPLGQEPAEAQEHKPLLLPHIDQDMNWDSLCVRIKLHSPATASHRKAPRVGHCQEPNGLGIVGPPLHPQPSFEELAARGSGSGPRTIPWRSTSPTYSLHLHLEAGLQEPRSPYTATAFFLGSYSYKSSESEIHTLADWLAIFYHVQQLYWRQD